jgi:hypothetical protein
MVQGDVDSATLSHVALVSSCLLSSCADFGGVADEAVAEGGDSPRVPVWSAGGSLVLDRRCASTKGAARVVFAVSYGTAMCRRRRQTASELL